VVFFVNNHEATLYLPNWHGQERAEIRLNYSREESSSTRPELATDYERQIGQIQ
jgi:hypothetical protein